MTKVVINACYGGFSLSEEAKMLLSIKSGKKWSIRPDCARHDPMLVEVVEALGRQANGRYAELEVVDIGDEEKYRVCEYDGSEWVETPNTIEDWVYV